MKMLMPILLALVTTVASAAQWRTDPLTPLDQRYMEERRQELNSLVQISMGRSFGHGRDSDLRLI
ncbi:MAG: hypothetical protein ACPH56_14270, partial [Spongiibacter marinus]